MEQKQKHWCAVWGNAVSIAEHRPEGYARNITLRYPIDIPFSGTALRITLDNFCCNEPVHIGAATVSFAAPGKNCYKDLCCPVVPDQIAELTFGGAADVLLPPHGRVQCDALPLEVPAGSTLCVSLYLDGFTPMQSAVLITGALSKGFFSFGDQTHSAKLPMNETKPTNWFYFLTDVDLYTDTENHAIVCYGDSITAQDWPDELKLRLRKMGASHTAVIRRAASGTRILREYNCIVYDSYGMKGQKRFPHEIPTAGADALIIQQGINDIIHPVGTDVNIFRPMEDLPTLPELIQGLEWYLDQAERMGLPVYLGTLLPIYGWRTYAPFREELRSGLNAWIRNCSRTAGYIDFDLVLRDSAKPECFAPGYDSGDHLHPSNAAYRAMAHAIPENLVR